MLKKFGFYVRHSLNDLRVNPQRTFFALLCIAAGVAAIVSLQTLAVMIADTLTGNLQQSNRGDIQLALGMPFGGDEQEELSQQGVEDGILMELPTEGPFMRPGVTLFGITLDGIQRLQDWLESTYPGQVEVTYRLSTTDFSNIFLGTGIGTAITAAETGATATSLTPILIEADKYPFYGSVVSLDGQPLTELIQAPTDIVLDEKSAEILAANIGDVVHIGGAEGDFTVRGIVPTESEITDPFTGLLASQFGFYYLDSAAIQAFPNLTPQVETVYLRLVDPTQATDVAVALGTTYPYLDTTTIDDLREQNQAVSEQINQVVTVMGLVSLLLGSIGIINTMQVIVRRRTVEVAVLKTIGLQADQVTVLFLVEAFIMGLVGSIAGVLLGWATTFIIKGVAESLVAQAIPFRIALAPVVNGIFVGTLVSTIFGFLPTLAAGQVRPGVVLRPNDNIVPRAGRLRSLLALLVIMLALSFVAYSILGNFGIALAATIGAFFAAGFLLLLLSFLIWLVGRFFPSLGIVDLKISLRQMLAGRGRAAITLLALVVGVFSLSLITLFADSINNMLTFALEEGSGGNVFVSVAFEPGVARVEEILGSLEGVNDYQVIRAYAVRLVGVEKADTGETVTVEQLKVRANQYALEQQPFVAGNEEMEDFDFGEVYLNSYGVLDTRALDQLPDETFAGGRGLTAVDTGQPFIVVADSPGRKALGIDVGDTLIYEVGEGENVQRLTFEVVGMTQQSALGGALGAAPAYTLNGALPEGLSTATNSIIVDIAEAQIPELRRQMSNVPGTFVIETAFFTKLLNSLLGTFTAFPTMVALLGLVVGGVVIANSVALTTMERRREIAVMKAVGLQRERVLGMLLLENGLMGLVGGLIGVGIGLLSLIILLSATGAPGQAIPYGTALVLMLLCIGVALIAAATTAWGASGEKPLNVLRYE